MAEEMSLPSDIVANDFAYVHESPTEFLGEREGSKLSPTTQQFNFLLDGITGSQCTDCVTERFLDGVEKSFCMGWELNQATCEWHTVVGTGGEDEGRRSMSVYSDLVLEEIAQQNDAVEAIATTSASSLPDEEKVGDDGDKPRRKPILKLDTVMASAYAFVDPQLTRTWSSAAASLFEETHNAFSVYVSPMDRPETPVASAREDENAAMIRKCSNIRDHLLSLHDQASESGFPAISSERSRLIWAPENVASFTRDTEAEPATQTRAPFSDRFKRLMKRREN